MWLKTWQIHKKKMFCFRLLFVFDKSMSAMSTIKKMFCTDWTAFAITLPVNFRPLLPMNLQTNHLPHLVHIFFRSVLFFSFSKCWKKKTEIFFFFVSTFFSISHTNLYIIIYCCLFNSFWFNLFVFFLFFNFCFVCLY